jgi:hypothetical protein
MQTTVPKRRTVIIAVAAVAGAIAFLAYFGIETAKNMDVAMHDSTVASKDDVHTFYNAKIQLRNTSFMPLSIGYTSYNININGEYLGSGTMEPFTILPYSTMLADSEFTAINEVLDKYDGKIPYEQTQLEGTSNYNLYFTSFDVPFNHNPTEEQVKKFNNN